MKHYFSIIMYSVGALLLIGVVIGVYRSQVSATGDGGYQASVLDSFASAQSPAPAASEDLETSDSPAAHQSPVASPEVSVLPIALATVPAQSPVFPSVAVVPPAVDAPVFVAPSILTSSAGSGGTLTNRAVAPVVMVEVASTTTVTTPTVVASSSLGISATVLPAATTSVSVATTPVVTATTTDSFVCTPDASSTPPAVSLAPHVVISELFIDMVGADSQEFVELYNPTGQMISLASSSLQYLSSTATSTAGIVKKNFAAEASIYSHGFYLVGMGGYTGSVTADMLWSQSLGNEGGSVLLVANHDSIIGSDDQDITDRVAYGSGAFLLGEGSPASLPPAGSSLIRATFSGSNAADFSVSALPVARSASSTTQ